MSVIVYYNTNSRQRQSFSGYDEGSESYTGPSSYTTSFQNDYPGYGNYGSILNMKNPPITSSYSSFGPSSESNSFGSTSFVNYPPTYENANSSPQNPFRPSFTSSQAWPSQANPSQVYNSGTSTYGEETDTISQHIEVTKPIAVPIYKRFPYPVEKKFHVAIPHPVLGKVFVKLLNIFSRLQLPNLQCQFQLLIQLTWQSANQLLFPFSGKSEFLSREKFYIP